MITYPCDILREYHINGSNSGIHWGSQADAGEIIGYEKEVANFCLECPYDECLAKKRDDHRAKRDRVA